MVLSFDVLTYWVLVALGLGTWAIHFVRDPYARQECIVPPELDGYAHHMPKWAIHI